MTEGIRGSESPLKGNSGRKGRDRADYVGRKNYGFLWKTRGVKKVGLVKRDQKQ